MNRMNNPLIRALVLAAVGALVVAVVFIQLRNWQVQGALYELPHVQADFVTAQESLTDAQTALTEAEDALAVGGLDEDAAAELETRVAELRTQVVEQGAVVAETVAEIESLETYIAGTHFDLFNLNPGYDLLPVVLVAVLAGLFIFTWALGAIDPMAFFTGEPNLSKGLMMAFIGFFVGAGIVTIIRGLQGVDPIWDTGVALSLATFTTAGFFLVGVGAADPEMSVHGEHAIVPVEPEAEKEEAPGRILGTYLWRIAAIVTVGFIILMAIALWPGAPLLVVTDIPEGSVSAAGVAEITLPFGGPTIQTSQFVILALFIVIIFVSLAIFAGGVSLLIYILNRDLTIARSHEPTVEERTPPAPVQWVSKHIFGGLARALRGLPRFLGQK